MREIFTLNLLLFYYIQFLTIYNYEYTQIFKNF